MKNIATPVFISAALIAIFLASELWKVPNKDQFLCPLQKFYMLTGEVKSSPKLSAGKTVYYFTFSPNAAYGYNYIKAGCRGKITLLINTSLYDNFVLGTPIINQNKSKNNLFKNKNSFRMYNKKIVTSVHNKKRLIDTGTFLIIRGTLNKNGTYFVSAINQPKDVATVKKLSIKKSPQLTLNNDKYTNTLTDTFYLNEFENQTCSPKYIKTFSKIIARIYNLRALQRAAFKDQMDKWGKSGGLFLALLLGSRDTLEPAVAQAFRITGTSFILALSGMHLGLWAVLVLFLTNKLFGKHVSLVLSFFVITYFVFIVGATPSLLRSYIFFLLSIFFIATGLNVAFLDRLSITFLIHIAIAPADFWTIAFQLSYLAVFGMAIFGERLSIILTRFLPQVLSAPLAQSLSCNIATLWLTIKTFGYFAPIGIIAGVVLSPFILLFMYIGVTLWLLGAIIPSVLDLSGIFMNFLYNIIKSIIFLFSLVPPILISNLS